MFLCPACKTKFVLPKCTCGYVVTKESNIWQLSDSPDIVIDGEGDKYIGYEHIGEGYSGNRKYIIEEKDYLVAKEIANITADGIFLDLACGDGCLTVPVASFGTKIIAGDISNAMIKILEVKAAKNAVSLNNVTLCRMNALNIPISDNSIDTITANGVLHLISNPEKVIKEIYRVLKPGGYFICMDDAPGKYSGNERDNSKYLEIVNNFDGQYWKELKKYNISPQKYNWNFDRNTICNKIFSSSEIINMKHHKETTIPMKDGFLPRFQRRGFSSQVQVPEQIHKKVTEQLLSDFRSKYGDDFDEICFNGFESDLVLTLYIK